MSLGYILKRAGAKMGLNPADPDQRQTLLYWVNEGAREVYDQADEVGTLMEQVFKVNGDQTVSMPWYVGPLRGAREYASMQAWHVNQMRPRYNSFNWPDMWRNYRLRNKQALMATVSNQSVGVLTVPAVETPAVVVSLTGPTTVASSVTEIVTMDAVQKFTVNQFLDYTNVTKNVINGYDVMLSDVDGKLLTVIPNCMFQAQYQIVDVSSCPWLPQNTSTFDNYMEFLYKKVLPILYNDNDEFPGIGYDDVIVNKMLQLWNEEQGKPDMAIAYDSKATRSMARKLEEQNRDTEDMVAFVANPHDTMLKRIGTGLRRRYSLYAGRKY